MACCYTNDKNNIFSESRTNVLCLFLFHMKQEFFIPRIIASQDMWFWYGKGSIRGRNRFSSSRQSWCQFFSTIIFFPKKKPGFRRSENQQSRTVVSDLIIQIEKTLWKDILEADKVMLREWLDKLGRDRMIWTIKLLSSRHVMKCHM